jgi:hypothetical protein
MHSVWTHERDVALVRAWHEGLSATEVAAQFDVLHRYRDKGKSAVLGRIDRLRKAAHSDAERAFWSRSLPGWSHEADIALARMWSEGVTAQKMVRMLPFLAAYADPHTEIRKRATIHRRTACSAAELAFWDRRDRRFVRSTDGVSKRTIGRHRARWTIGHVAELALCCAQGLTAYEIAEKLGIFTHCNDGGRCAVLGKIDRMRDAATDDAERLFWTCSENLARGVRKKRSSRPRVVAIQRKPPTPKRPRSRKLSLQERMALIDSVVIPRLPAPTDDEVRIAHAREVIAEADRLHALVPAE